MPVGAGEVHPGEKEAQGDLLVLYNSLTGGGSQRGLALLQGTWTG